MSKPVELDVDLVARLWDVQESIQRTMDLVSFGLSAPLHEGAEGRTVFPGLPFQINTTHGSPLDEAELRDEFSAWLLSNGFRELIEYAGDHLGKLRDVCATLKLLTEPDVARCPSGFFLDWKARDEADGKRFHKMALRKKIGHLKAHYSTVLGTEIEVAVNSINAARNCYVHRRGLVTQGIDATEESPLRLCWIGVTVQTYGEDGGLKAVDEPADLRRGGLYMFGSKAKVRLFKPGEIIRVTSREFNEMALTIYAYAKTMIERVYEFAEELGLHFGDELERVWRQPTRIYLYLNTGPDHRAHHQAVPVDWRDGTLRFATSANLGGGNS